MHSTACSMQHDVVPQCKPACAQALRTGEASPNFTCMLWTLNFEDQCMLCPSRYVMVGTSNATVRYLCDDGGGGMEGKEGSL